MFPPFGSGDADVARAYAEIVAGTDDPELKFTDLLALQRTIFDEGPMRSGPGSIDKKIIAVLIESAAVEDDGVRLAAVNLLMTQIDNPEVRAVLETVLKEDPSLSDMLRIDEALARPPSTAVPMR